MDLLSLALAAATRFSFSCKIGRWPGCSFRRASSWLVRVASLASGLPRCSLRSFSWASLAASFSWSSRDDFSFSAPCLPSAALSLAGLFFGGTLQAGKSYQHKEFEGSCQSHVGPSGQLKSHRLCVSLSHTHKHTHTRTHAIHTLHTMFRIIGLRTATWRQGLSPRTLHRKVKRKMQESLKRGTQRA